MNVNEQIINDQPLEVGYIIAYDDGRRDKFGRFPLPGKEREPEQLAIFKKMAELEPSIREASYIFSSIRLQKSSEDPQTIEYKRDEIKAMLHKLARPGIIKRYLQD